MVAVIGATMLPRIICYTSRERLGITMTGRAMVSSDEKNVDRWECGRYGY